MEGVEICESLFWSLCSEIVLKGRQNCRRMLHSVFCHSGGEVKPFTFVATRFSLHVWVKQILVLRSRQILVLRSRQILVLRSRQILVLRSRQILVLRSRQMLVLRSRQILVLRSRQILVLRSRQILVLGSRQMLVLFDQADAGAVDQRMS